MLKRRPLEALRALRELVRNPEDTAQVFVIMRALSGDAIAKGTARFAGCQTGVELLRNPRDLVSVLTDRTRLAKFAEGSLARAYLDVVGPAGITAEGLVTVSEETAREYVQLTADQGVYAKRLRDSHDLWHTVTGYGTDTFGEVCVVAFSYGQTRNLGFAVIALIGALKIARVTGEAKVLRAAWQAYRDGRDAAWLPPIVWEHLLDRPLTDVRQLLRVAPPTRYRSLRARFSTPVFQSA
jgi:ubiquinone biosynthesis protein COQ4